MRSPRELVWWGAQKKAQAAASAKVADLLLQLRASGKFVVAEQRPRHGSTPAPSSVDAFAPPTHAPPAPAPGGAFGNTLCLGMSSARDSHGGRDHSGAGPVQYHYGARSAPAQCQYSTSAAFAQYQYGTTPVLIVRAQYRSCASPVQVQ